MLRGTLSENGSPVSKNTSCAALPAAGATIGNTATCESVIATESGAPLKTFDVLATTDALPLSHVVGIVPPPPPLATSWNVMDLDDGETCKLPVLSAAVAVTV